MRVKRGFKARRRRNKILKLAKGFHGRRSKLFRTAKNAVMKALTYAYRDRRVRRREIRGLWIVRINAATRMRGVSYSKFMNALKKANIEIDRKILADLALNDANAFTAIFEKARPFFA